MLCQQARTCRSRRSTSFALVMATDLLLRVDVSVTLVTLNTGGSAGYDRNTLASACTSTTGDSRRTRRYTT